MTGPTPSEPEWPDPNPWAHSQSPYPETAEPTQRVPYPEPPAAPQPWVLPTAPPVQPDRYQPPGQYQPQPPPHYQQAPYPPAPYQQNPYQQNPYQQNPYQQGWYPPGPYPQGPYQPPYQGPPLAVLKPSKAPRVVGIVAAVLLVLCCGGFYAVVRTTGSTADQSTEIVDAFLEIGAPAGFVNDRVNSSLYATSGSQRYDLVCPAAPKTCPTDGVSKLADWAQQIKLPDATLTRLGSCSVPCSFVQTRGRLAVRAKVTLYPQARSEHQVAASVTVDISRQ